MASLETNEKACVIAGVAISRFLGLRIPAVVIATADFVELKRVGARYTPATAPSGRVSRAV
jgi:hypothetical protein